MNARARAAMQQATKEIVEYLKTSSCHRSGLHAFEVESGKCILCKQTKEGLQNAGVVQG